MKKMKINEEKSKIMSLGRETSKGPIDMGNYIFENVKK